MGFYLHFILDMAKSPGFRSMATDFTRYFTLGFPSPPVLNTLNSPVTITRRTVLQSTTPPFNGLCLLVSTRFQVLFHSLPGCFSPFPHGTVLYRSSGSILAWRVVPRLPLRDSSCRSTLDRLRSLHFRLRGSHTLWPAFPDHSSNEAYRHCRPQPRTYCYVRGLASSDFRHYFRNLG